MPQTLFTIFFLSLAGSLHCAGMCGGFVSYCGSCCGRPYIAQTSYHLGRLVSYLSLGAIAGILGGLTNVAGAFVGIQQLAAILVAVMLVLWGVREVFLVSRSGNDSPGASQLGGMQRKILSVINRFGGWQRALFLGLSSTLLPCGWLYGFVALAGSSGDPLWAMAIMFVFWLGGLPALISVGAATRLIASKLGVAVPRVTACLFVIGGLSALAFHVMPLMAAAPAASCH